MKYTVAVAQIDSRLGDVEANIELHFRAAESAQAAGASLVVFPELSLHGYTLRDLSWDTALDPRTDGRLADLKRLSKDISIVFGFAESAPDHGIYNSAVWMEDGSIGHIHRKMYPPTYGMFEEGRYFSQGRTARAFSSKLGRFGMLICEDAWHVSVPYLLTLDGAEALVVLTASPTRLGAEETLRAIEINHEHQRTYARLLSSYIIFANRIGFEDGVNFWGGSLIVNPFGEMIAKGKNFDSDLITAEIEWEEVKRARRFSRHLLDEKPELTSLNLREIIRRRRSSD